MSLLLNLFFCKINEFNFADISFLSFFFVVTFFNLVKRIMKGKINLSYKEPLT